MNIQDYFRPDEQPLDTLLSDGGFCGIFRTITCVGDSLSSGEFQTQREDGTFRYHDMYEYSWGQYIARATGSTVYNMSRGGMTAKELMSIDAYWDAAQFPPTQGYILALGVNDILNQKQEVGTLDDIAADWRENADTFAGHYAGVIQRIKERQPNARFFLMTMPKEISEERNAGIDAHAALLHQLAEKFDHCYVMDFCRYAPKQDEAYRERFYMYGHLNAAGYVLTAKMVMSYMDYLIRHNLRDFDLVGYIGREEMLEG